MGNKHSKRKATRISQVVTQDQQNSVSTSKATNKPEVHQTSQTTNFKTFEDYYELGPETGRYI
jgi:hypothetical protein